MHDKAKNLPTTNSASVSDEKIRDSILKFANARGVEKTFCPSEVAKDLKPDNWRPLMAEVRRVVALLLKDGLVAVTQFGHPVDPLDAKGHIRISISPDSLGDCQR